MGRPARKLDVVLAEDLRSYMDENGRTVTEVAAMVGVDKATISRALATATFSRSLDAKVAYLVKPRPSSSSVGNLLQKSLHLLEMSDRLRVEAERMLTQALDRATQTK